MYDIFMQKYRLDIKPTSSEKREQIADELQVLGYQKHSQDVWLADDFIEVPKHLKSLVDESWQFDSLEEMKLAPRKYSPQEIEFIENLEPRSGLSATPLPLED